jgi:2-oxoglutarate dehydrogenase E2 component (dihydrolipoamide succinyltransferase)
MANGHREEGVRASPSVRRLAREYDIDLAGVAGSGSGGRITKDDVERLIREQHRSDASERQPVPEEDGRREERTASQETPAPAAEDGREERVRMSRRRQTIAQRLVEAQQTTAMLTTFNEADMSAVMELRRRRKDEFQERHEVRLGFMSFFTKAAIGALKAFPKVNSELQGNELVLKHYYDVGVAVNTDEGLVVPVVRDADRKSFAEIERDIADLRKKARDGKLTLEDLSGGTFTITNGGIFGSLVSTPILNIPQVAILGMHKIQDRPVAVDGKVEIRPMMYLALSYDHRIVDGADAVSFLVRIKELIEDPESLLLEG